MSSIKISLDSQKPKPVTTSVSAFESGSDSDNDDINPSSASLTKFGRVLESNTEFITTFETGSSSSSSSKNAPPPVVIPLTKHAWVEDDDVDTKALPLLQAAIHPSLRHNNGNNNNNNNNNNNADKLQFEMSLKADDNTTQTYKAVKVADFGAALLRGMGWSDDADKAKTKAKDASRKKIGVDPNFGKIEQQQQQQSKIVVRGERVGLGAVTSGNSERGYKGKRRPGDKEDARDKVEREGREYWEEKASEERRRREANDSDSSSSPQHEHKHKHKNKKKKHKKEKMEKSSKHDKKRAKHF